jgi:hypothetical protein
MDQPLAAIGGNSAGTAIPCTWNGPARPVSKPRRKSNNSWAGILATRNGGVLSTGNQVTELVIQKIFARRRTIQCDGLCDCFARAFHARVPNRPFGGAGG